jgi:HK97 family phage major capsid protein
MDKQDLIQQRAEALSAADDILKRVKDENRKDLTGDEEKRFDELHATADKLKGTIDRFDRQEAAMAGAGRRTEPAQPGDQRPATRSHGAVTDGDRNEALRAWLLGSNASEAQRSAAARCGLDVASNRVFLSILSPKELRATDLKSPRPADVEAWRNETRAALTGAQSTTTTGGYTVPDALMQALEVSLLAFGGMRQVATIIRTATGAPLPVPTTNDTAQKGRLLSENTAATETEMTFGQIVFDAYKYSSDSVLASIEFLQDTSIDVASFLGSALGTRIARLQNDHFTTGTGSGQPNGIVTASSAGVSSVADPPTYDNIIDLIHSVDPAYRANARFMLNDATLKSIKKIKVLQYSGDTTGVPLWQPSLVAGQPDQIHGFSYVVNQSMASPGSSAKKMLFGDFSKYWIRDVREVELVRLNELYAAQHSVGFLAFARSDGDLIDAGTDPVKHMAQA